MEYYDKFNNEIKIDNFILFDNGSKYKVETKEEKMILCCLSITNLPTILLSKITFGNTLCSALITN